MPKKIFIVLGSPKKDGNSATLAKQVEIGARDAGADVTTVFLQKRNISPCTACDQCLDPSGVGCIINDGMTPLYDLVKDSDVIVLATPIYWFNYSAQLKLFIDRLYAIQSDNRYAFTGKEVAFILTYADSNLEVSGGKNALNSLMDMCNFMKAKVSGILHGSAEKAGDIKMDEIIMQDALILGRSLGKSSHR